MIPTADINGGAIDAVTIGTNSACTQLVVVYEYQNGGTRRQTGKTDNETEEEIVNEIKTLKGKMTFIIIAHRLSTLKFCDKIYKIENGEIINIGPGKELIAKQK